MGATPSMQRKNERGTHTRSPRWQHGGRRTSPRCARLRSLRRQRVASGAPMKVLSGAPLDCAREPGVWDRALPPRLQR
eukprot:5514386-Prymnesium_polylepis.1